jgi:hypothetical protein
MILARPFAGSCVPILGPGVRQRYRRRAEPKRSDSRGDVARAGSSDAMIRFKQDST